jgi:hypothetical protein
MRRKFATRANDVVIDQKGCGLTHLVQIECFFNFGEICAAATNAT